MKNELRFYMDIAKTVSMQSYAKRNKVGAIIVKNGNIISFGYNGTPKGFSNVCEINSDPSGELITKPEVLHAESNAIAKCAKSTYSCDGADLYVTVSPCVECAKLIIQSGIKRVIYEEEYRIAEGLLLLLKAKIIIYHLPKCDQ